MNTIYSSMQKCDCFIQWVDYHTIFISSIIYGTYGKEYVQKLTKIGFNC